MKASLKISNRRDGPRCRGNVEIRSRDFNYANDLYF